MPKQYPLIGALRFATIARLFAAGLERFRQLVFSNRAGFSACLRAIRAAAIAGCIMLAFEAAKQAIHPKVSIWTSHALTILFTALAGGAVTFAALRKGTEAALRQLEIQYRQLFDSNPLPMWVFERKTLKFLEVNEAASRQYGFSNREFLTMTIADISPEEGIADQLEATEKRMHGLHEPIIWRHRNKNDEIMDVEVVGHDLHWHGIEAQLVAARDVTERRRVQDAMIESEGRYRSLFENMLEGFAYCEMLFDDRGRPKDFVYLAVNSAFGRLTGLENVVGKRFTEVIPGGEDSHPELVERYGRVVLTCEPERFEIEIRALGLWFSISAHSARKGCFVAVFDNITERKQTEKALLFKNALLEAQAETTIDGILVVDESDHIVLVNKQFGQHFGIPNDLLSTKDDLIVRKHVTDKVEDPDAFVERVKYLNSRRGEKSRDELRFKNGKVFDRYSAPLIDSRSQYCGRIWYFRDITDRKVAEERVQYLAYYDALTGLPNRTLLQDRLEKALSSARRRKHKVALLFLDLDRFKDINDSLGHSVGDLFLQEVGERLKSWGREQDTVARLGGDEFVIMLTELKDASDAAAAAERLMDTMTAEFVVQGRPLSINCSLGISVFPEHGADGETLIKNADAAMYSAKDNGRNNYRFFAEEMNARVAERLKLENSLRFALEKEQLYLVYQPQMDIATGSITGMEALLRWQHRDLGLVPPDKFIRIAENTGLIVPIGEWVLRTACRQARKWQDEGLPAVSVAVNVSAVQFRQEGFCQLIGRVLRDSGLAPRYLELELTESVLLANAEVMLSLIQELKAMGLTLAIDDFGTGYSSFSYLRQFRVNKFKIDRSFIQDVAVNADDAAITAAIIGMAKSLRLKVIAEGVETEAQMSFLRTHQCDEIQGYYFSKPLSAEEGADKLRSSAVHALSASQGT